MKKREKKNNKKVSSNKEKNGIERVINSNYLFVFDEDKELFEELAKENKYMDSILRFSSR